MADLPPSERPFSFFELPRELRDEIYLYCTEDCKPRTANGEEQISFDDDDDDPKGQWYEIRVFCERGPSRSLHLVSRQFSSEYLDIVRKQAEVHFYDEYLSCDSEDWAPPLSDHLFTQFSNAKLYLLECSAHGEADDLSNHCKWVSEMQHQFGMLSKVEITLRLITSGKPVHYPNDPDGGCSDLLEKITKIIDLTGASSFEVIIGKSSAPLGGKDLSQDDEFQNTSTSYGKWSKQGGWVVEGAKQG